MSRVLASLGLVVLALLLLAPLTSYSAYADPPCKHVTKGPLAPDVVPDFTRETYDLPLNPSCRVYAQTYDTMRYSMLAWSLGTYRNLYYANETTKGSFFDYLPHCGADKNANYHLPWDTDREGFKEQGLLQDGMLSCESWQEILGKVVISGFTQTPTATRLIFSNPSNFFYDNATVIALENATGLIAMSLLGTFMLISFVRAVGARSLGFPSNIRALSVRMFVGFLIILSWGLVSRLLIESATSLTAFLSGFLKLLLHVEAADLLGLVNPVKVDYASLTGGQTVALSFYAWGASLLAIVFVVRVFVLDMLLVMGPLGILLLIFPETRRLGQIWSSTLVYTLLFQPFMAAILWISAVFVFFGGPVAKSDALGGGYLFADTPQLILAGGALTASLAGAFALQSFTGSLFNSPLMRSVGRWTGFAAKRGEGKGRSMLRRFGFNVGAA